MHHPLPPHTPAGRLLPALLISAMTAATMAGATFSNPGFAETRLMTVGSLTATTIAPDGRLFLCQQPGRIYIHQEGVPFSTATPFLDISAEVDSSGERGLESMVFDPAFATNRFVYVYYTVKGSPAHNRVKRFVANGDVADRTSPDERVIMDLENLSGATNHNGGAMLFHGGKLFIAVGENANGTHAQNLGNRLGKVLRINADGSIPADNPFVGVSGARGEIWALGLRNPFTMTVHPGNGTIFVNDVGQSTWEEIDRLVRQANYGWPGIEGFRTTQTPPANYHDPVYAYRHGSAADQGIAITGGAFYAPTAPGIFAFPTAFRERYFYADYGSGWIRTIDPASPATSASFATGIAAPVDLDVAPDGTMYCTFRGDGGGVWRIRHTGNLVPTISQQPQSLSVSTTQTASFTVVANGPSLQYAWDRRPPGGSVFAAISGATAASYTTGPLTTADSGAAFRCRVSNPYGAVTSASATLTVLANRPPVPSITQPASGATYGGGQVITFAGSASDPEQGTLPASAFSWLVEFHHQTHTHPFLGPVDGVTQGTFTAPVLGEPDPVQFYRIILTVTDNQGARTTVSRDVAPRTVAMTFTTQPGGYGLTLDGQPLQTPSTITGVVGMQRTIGVPSPQQQGGVLAAFASWSDGGAQTHVITTPTGATTYRANLVSVGWQGSYYDNRDFTGTRTVRPDPAINFNWGTGAPMAGMGADGFSIRWRGLVMPAYSQTYTFTATADDGVRVWVDGRRVIDRWIDQGATASSGQANLVAGTPVLVVMEYYENTGYTRAQLEWQSASQARQVIPYTAVTPAPGDDLPGGWTTQDVGTVASTGSAVEDAGTWTVAGSGADIWNNADEFRFVWQRVTGDVRITARVTSLANTNVWAKAGVMVRESLAAGSPHAFTCVTPERGVAFQRRRTTAGTSTHTAGPLVTAPYWVRLERIGSTLIGSASNDGSTWTEVGRDTVPMAAPVWVGMAVTSHADGAVTTATIRDVQIIATASVVN